MSGLAVRVENVGKQYRIGRRLEGYRTLRDVVASTVSRTVHHGHAGSGRPGGDETIWALKDISFEIAQGEVVGIIGRNGAGKSTLLKVLTRITEPTEGYAELHGRAGSLLEVGTGFHPELTGRENIYLNGAILGMRKTEIERKFDEIVDFAEIEKFLDTPVKRYSSGMYVRLAFAVAAHLEPEILLVDEVLAVGDAAFQKKCLGKMGEVAKTGRTVLFVSHNMAAVQNLCTVGFVLERGQLAYGGRIDLAIAHYLDLLGDSGTASLEERTERQGDGRLRFMQFRAVGGRMGDGPVVLGQPASFVLSYEGRAPLRNIHVSIGVHTPWGEGAMYLSNDLVGKSFDELPVRGALRCDFEQMPLLPGSYQINLYCTVNGVLADWVMDAAMVDVAEGDYFGTGKTQPKGYGTVAVPHCWDVVA